MKKYLISFFALIGLLVMIMAATNKGVFDQKLMQVIFTKLPDGDLSFNTNSLFIKKSNGNIGIGTTNPLGIFDVNSKLTVLSNGNVGIGTTIPGTSLDVDGDATVRSGHTLKVDAITNLAGTDSPNGATPVGSVMAYMGSTAPTGWVLAYGQEVAQVGTYANLYTVLSTTYCTTDHGGTCTGGNFRIPDLRGRFLGGKDNMGGSAATRITSAKTIDGTVLGKGNGNLAEQVTQGAHSDIDIAHGHGFTNPNMPAHYHTNNAFAYQYLGSTSKGLGSAVVTIANFAHTHSGGGISGNAANSSHDHDHGSLQADMTVGGGGFLFWKAAPAAFASDYASTANIGFQNLVQGRADATHVSGYTGAVWNGAAITGVSVGAVTTGADRSVTSGTTDISHNHTGSIGACTAGTNGTCSTGTSGDSAQATSGGSVTSLATTNKSISAHAAINNLPPTIIVNYIIKL